MKAWRAKMTNERKDEANKKKREHYRRNKCVNEYTTTKGLANSEVISLINNKNCYIMRNIISYFLMMFHAW